MKRIVKIFGTAVVSACWPIVAFAQAEMVCGLEVYQSPTAVPEPEPSPDPQPDPGTQPNPGESGDPCLDGETVFGPARFEKTTLFARWAHADVTLDAAGDVCIISRGSAFRDPRKAFPYIYLDGTNIARPRDLFDDYDEQIHELDAGQHQLDVLVRGLRGSYVDVEFRQIPGGGAGGDDNMDFPGLPMPGEVQIDPDTGALDMVNSDGTVRLQNVAADHPLLTANGDGNHDTTVLQALTTPLVDLPGKNDGSVAYFLDWQFQITDLDTCATIDPGLSGTKQINSPTLVETTWDGTDITGALLPDGNYAYNYEVDIVDEFGAGFGGITSPAFGIAIASAPTDYIEWADVIREPCDAATDPWGCGCPGVDGVPGTPDPNCEFARIPDLLPELGAPNFMYLTYQDPTYIDKSFITTTQDAATGRYTVTVDLRHYNAGGLVPKGRGVWSEDDSLRQWVADMTGVPKSTGDSLFNFDYVQLGTSTGVEWNGIRYSMNHFLLDAITNDVGTLRNWGGAVTVAFANTINDDAMAPPKFALTNPRAGDECSHAGNTNGANSLRGKFCAYNTAVPISDKSDLGIYMLRTSLFDIEYNGETTTLQQICTTVDGISECGVRTVKVPADTLEIEVNTYVENGGDPAYVRTKTIQLNDAVGVSLGFDRGDGEGGVCSSAVITRGGLAVVMHAADGAVPDSCVINGIF
ncbi:MAG: hypothetical protein WB812_12675 [Woeseiaceae bacterium]